MLQHLLGLPFTLISFVVALSVVVFVHEFGHFFIARRCGVRCESFSIGFGPELFGYTDRLGTRWKFSLIPLGGYVRMYGEAESMQTIEGGNAAEKEPRVMTPEEKAVSLKYKTVGQRAAIVFAGPAVNFLFAIAVFFVLFLVFGRPIDEPVVGEVIEGSAAADAGLKLGDRIVVINGKEILRFQDIRQAVQLGYGAPLAMKVKRGEETLDVAVTPRIAEGTDAFGNAQKTPMLGILPVVEPVVGDVVENSAAADAGLKHGDRILTINGKEILRFQDIQQAVQLGGVAPLAMSVKRGEQTIDVTVTPRIVERADGSGNAQKTPLLGISASGEARMTPHLGPVEALGMAVSQTYEVVEANAIAVSQMLTGQRGTEDLGGPIRIAKYSGQAAKAGPASFVVFVAILSISLGLINLLPVPLLDGGHLLFYAIEAVRGRPLSDQAQEWGMRVGLALVGSLLLFTFGNDIVRVFGPFFTKLIGRVA